MIKYFCISLLILCYSFFGVAQTEKIKELGIATGSLQTFGLSYKSGNLDKVTNLTIMSGNGGGQQTLFTDTEIQILSFNHNVSLLLVGENRKTINQKFEYRYGFGTFFAYRNTNQQQKVETIETVVKQNNFTFGLNYLIGGNILLSNNLILAIDISPYLNYNILQQRNLRRRENLFGGIEDLLDEKTTIGIFDYGLALNNILFTIAYRF